MNGRVLFMVQQFTHGGSERQCATAALGLQQRGWQVHAAALRPGGMRAAELAAAGLPLPVFPVRSFASLDLLRSGLAFASYLRQHRIDIVHTFDVPSNAFAIPWARFARVPRVYSSQRAHRDLTPASLRPLEKLSDRLAHRIVVNCRSVEGELVSQYAIAPAKIHLLYNGIDTALFHPHGPRAALPFSSGALPSNALPSNTLVIGTVCALRPEKDLPTLQRAFAQIAPDFPHAHLLFVGDGPERPSLAGAAAAANLIHRTHFAGSQADTTPWYRAINFFVLPSRSEALSNSLLEAQACGCHILASQTGGNPEITHNLFPPGDASALANLLRHFLSAPPRPAPPLPSTFTVPYMLDTLAALYRA
ncbi:MAG: glycosyltransferase [Bryobacter sp.]|nr:glycosyltransferase [Bryobacter sp.]